MMGPFTQRYVMRQEWEKLGGHAASLSMAGAQAAIDHSGARLKHTLRAAWLPAHLRSLFMRALTKKLTVDSLASSRSASPSSSGDNNRSSNTD